MKLIYTLILLLFSSSVFAEFSPVKSSISDLLNYGFRIEQIDTIKHGIDVVFVYHLKYGVTIAICIYTGKTLCTVDTQDKSLIELLNEDDYLEQLNKELLDGTIKIPQNE